jgi:FtsP/CotA-like multicopper oxidase with cupredoxin domain
MDYESYFGSGHFANTGMPYLGRVLLVARLSDLDVLQSPRQFGKLVRATSSTSSQIAGNDHLPPDVPRAIVKRVVDFFADLAASLYEEDMHPEEYVARCVETFAVCPPVTVDDRVCSQSTAGHCVFLSNETVMLEFEATVLFGGVRKFVDSLATPGRTNSLGHTIPVAVPDTRTYPGSDYYEIAMVEFQHKFHSDLPSTTCRGYVQLNGPGGRGAEDSEVPQCPEEIKDNEEHSSIRLTPQYGGPLIEAQSDRPVRIKFVNQLPTGQAGLLKIPCDTTAAGCGLGPDGISPYTQNRALLHLHGGVNPWISDGNPHQWVAPKGERTPLQRGALHANVPDMPDPGPGATTYYFTNQQSGRLMFYHDLTFGLTRLNFYVGAAGVYRLHDQAEADLVKRGVLPAQSTPLMIQDKTFVPPADQLDYQDPTWNVGRSEGLPWGAEGSFWYPHVYAPTQNPNTSHETMGSNALGRWDYGPWVWPGATLQHPPTIDEGDKRLIPSILNPSTVPEAFGDTMTVNGTAFPFHEVARQTYRFQILNGSSDRTLNLQLHRAAGHAAESLLLADGSLGELHTRSGDVVMVPAVSGLPALWPTDGRDGGVPDPGHTGPRFVQIGNDGGLLPRVVEHLNNPVAYEYNRRNAVVLSVSTANLLLGPAERADVLVDFSGCQPGDVIILYNDAPAAMPAFDPRVDYYTGSPDLVASGGAPPIVPGFGPNTRTVLQFRVTDGPAALPLNVALLDAEISAAYVRIQDPPIVPQSEYARCAGSALDERLFTDHLVCIHDHTVKFQTANASASAAGFLGDRGTVAHFLVTEPGANYSPPDTVVEVDQPPPGGSPAVASCEFWEGHVSSVKIVEGGAGYHLVHVKLVGTSRGWPVEVLTTASVQLMSGLDIPHGSILAVNLPAENTTVFDAPPAVQFPVVKDRTAAAEATLLHGIVVDIHVTDPGPSYWPHLQCAGGFGSEAVATLTLYKGCVAKVEITHPGYGYWSPPCVSVEGTPTGRPAVLKAAVTSRGQLESIEVVSGGSGYPDQASVRIGSDRPRDGAEATLSVSAGYVSGVVVLDGGSGFLHEPAVLVGVVPGVVIPASFAARVAHGRVVDVEVLEPGLGYIEAPALTIEGARVVATAVPLGSLDGCTVTNPGSGYAGTPTASVGGAWAGHGATFEVKVRAKNSVREVRVRDPGSGYESPPAVRIIDKLGFIQVRPLELKTLVDDFTLDYGRRAASGGVGPPTAEWSPLAEAKVAPALGDGTAFWRITHKGVNTRVIHFHLVNVQVINRVGVDGLLRKPDLNELGWKDSVRVNPLQDTMVAMRPRIPGVPFGVVDAVRACDVTKPVGDELCNHGWEYAWRDEKGFMQPVEMHVPSERPAALTLSSVKQRSPSTVQLAWGNPTPVVERLKYNRAGIAAVQVWRKKGEGPFFRIASLPSNASGFVDDCGVALKSAAQPTVSYKIVAVNAAGGADSNIITIEID